MSARCSALAIVFALLSACTTMDSGDRTIKSLEGRQPVIDDDQQIQGGRDKAIEGYKQFLKSTVPDAYRAEGMRRLADLEMERTEERQGQQNDATVPEPSTRSVPASGAPNSEEYRNTAKLYQGYLRSYPHSPKNDRVLYQLAKAHEYLGELPQALQTLNQLVKNYPTTPYLEEAQFRRGELLFVMKSYDLAEQAYQVVVKAGPASPFYEKALYKHGWSRFKQSNYEGGLDSFLAILDRKLAVPEASQLSSYIQNLGRAEKELLEDTFRVVSLSFSYLEGMDSVERYFKGAGHRAYEFEVYQRLGDLYLKQERIKDAADTYNAFVRQYPNHVQAPMFQVKVIEAFQQGNFASLVIDAKKEFATRYGITSEYRKLYATAYPQVLPYLKKNLEDLSRHYHATAQKSKSIADYEEAVTWYRAFLRSFPKDVQAPSMNFLLAEVLFEAKRYPESAEEYETSAYDYPHHAKSADAGYMALLAYTEQEKLLVATEKKVWQQRALASALRFADANPKDSRSPAVLTQSAEKLYSLNAPERAASVARSVLALKPEAEPALRRTAWTVVAHTEFERGSFDKAETAYREVLALTPAGAATRNALVERLASSVYKQGEQSRATGDLPAAVAHFQRVAGIAPTSAIRVTADYDAAAGLIVLKEWGAAAKALEAFRREYPGHPLQQGVVDKLAASYLEGEQWAKAAAEFEAMGVSSKDPEKKRAAAWQAAELYEKAGLVANAANNYERYVRQYLSPLEPAIEGRSRLAAINQKSGKTKEQHRWLNEMVQVEKAGGRDRTDRTRYLAGMAAFTLAEPTYDAYRKVRLVEPLKKSLKNKKLKMQDALKAYTLAAEYGAVEVTTRSTFRIAEIYNDFGRELLASQRPKKLSSVELEQYNVLLEEQAYPFEEKAIEIHEVNVQRVSQGVYDEWVKNSYVALSKLRPIRYAKPEKSEVTIDVLR